ncbi:hypothetical protein ZEAMMB73_Zm00001d034238 [Zea mays]|uniref:Uncharacterized protein n=1 Tax=Zea mays TaxID=4577 RepID=A0A1D6L6A2_MAIZE|nr:hypothetical protein ZEAMMB73_Zm00001d034238 [Zea mays]
MGRDAVRSPGWPRESRVRRARRPNCRMGSSFVPVAVDVTVPHERDLARDVDPAGGEVLDKYQLHEAVQEKERGVESLGRTPCYKVSLEGETSWDAGPKEQQIF